jgi:hypothetical protein
VQVIVTVIPVSEKEVHPGQQSPQQHAASVATLDPSRRTLVPLK